MLTRWKLAERNVSYSRSRPLSTEILGVKFSKIKVSFSLEPAMNIRLVDSLAQIIRDLAPEERQLLKQKLQPLPAEQQQLREIEGHLRQFEEQYQMESAEFHQRFVAGELGDGSEFFEWESFYQMWHAATQEFVLN